MYTPKKLYHHISLERLGRTDIDEARELFICWRCYVRRTILSTASPHPETPSPIIEAGQDLDCGVSPEFSILGYNEEQRPMESAISLAGRFMMD